MEKLPPPCTLLCRADIFFSWLLVSFSMWTAYIGDVVFELFIRSRHVWPSKRTADLQNMVVSIVRGRAMLLSELFGDIWIIWTYIWVTQKLIFLSIFSAEHQSQLLEKLKQDFVLTEKELQVLMRGRNAVTRSKNRRDPAAYQDSTSFEALVGYLYISDKERCTDLLNWLDANVDTGWWKQFHKKTTTPLSCEIGLCVGNAHNRFL